RLTVATNGRTIRLTKRGRLALPLETQGLFYQEIPMPKPDIEHFVVLMMENRSFDHIFGYRPGVNGLKGNESNLLNPTSPESDTNPAFVVSNAAPYAVTTGNGPGHSVDQTNIQLFNTRTPAQGQKRTNSGFVMAYSDEMVVDKVTHPTN